MNNFVKAIKCKENLSFSDAQKQALDAMVVFVEIPAVCTPDAVNRGRSNAIGKLECRIQRAVGLDLTRFHGHFELLH
jgi:hypothetical protein